MDSMIGICPDKYRDDSCSISPVSEAKFEPYPKGKGTRTWILHSLGELTGSY